MGMPPQNMNPGIPGKFNVALIRASDKKIHSR
jgi:hypothetical protein